MNHDWASKISCIEREVLSENFGPLNILNVFCMTPFVSRLEVLQQMYGSLMVLPPIAVLYICESEYIHLFQTRVDLMHIMNTMTEKN